MRDNVDWSRGLAGGIRAATAVALAASLATLALATSAQAQQPPVGLGTADSFAVLGGSAVTNTGPTVINGDLGVSPGTSVTGFPPGTVNGTIHAANAVAAQAQSDLTTAYNDAAGRTPAVNMPFGDMGGLIFTPGVYKRSSTLLLTGDVALDAQGNPNAVFIFQVGSTLTTASSSRVLLRNGARACNVFWQIGSSATLGTNTSFKGNILALTSITMNTGATLIEGRALARNGAVTLDNNRITRARCATPPPGTTPTPTPDGTQAPGTTPTSDGTQPAGQRPQPSRAIGAAIFTTVPRVVGRTVLRYGTRRSVTHTFQALVTGRNIRRVTFTLNGRRVGTLSGRPPFAVLVRAPRRGIHILRAHVTFGNGARPVNLTMRFRSRGAVRPGVPGRGFTG